MRTTIFQVDAFTTRRFAGNPAAVMPLEISCLMPCCKRLLR